MRSAGIATPMPTEFRHAPRGRSITLTGIISISTILRHDLVVAKGSCEALIKEHVQPSLLALSDHEVPGFRPVFGEQGVLECASKSKRIPVTTWIFGEHSANE